MWARHILQSPKRGFGCCWAGLLVPVHRVGLVFPRLQRMLINAFPILFWMPTLMDSLHSQIPLPRSLAAVHTANADLLWQLNTTCGTYAKSKQHYPVLCQNNAFWFA